MFKFQTTFCFLFIYAKIKPDCLIENLLYEVQVLICFCCDFENKHFKKMYVCFKIIRGSQETYMILQ